MRRATFPVLQLALLMSVLMSQAACGPDLTASTETVRPRIMLIAGEVDGEPERASVAFGDTVNVRFQVGFPAKPPSNGTNHLDGTAVVCLGSKAPDGTLLCWDDLGLDVTSKVNGPDELQLSFTLPAGATFSPEILALLGVFADDAPIPLEDIPAGTPIPPEVLELLDVRIALFGALCSQGAVKRVPGKVIGEDALSTVFACDSEDGAKYTEPLPYSVTLVPEFDRIRRNLNPTLSCDWDEDDGPNACGGVVNKEGKGDANEEKVPGTFVLARPIEDGAKSREIVSWPAPPADIGQRSFEGCKGEDGFRNVKVGDKEYELRVRLDPDDREGYTGLDPEGNEEERLEELLLYAAHTENGGSMGSRLALLDILTIDSELEGIFEYTPPAENSHVPSGVPAEGRIVRFYFGLRDDRGGADFTDRAVCLLPKK